MLSILIPTYNYNIHSLVSELQRQCDHCEVAYEISVIDDASHSFQAENSAINSLKNCSYLVLEKNIGRSAIRNLLAKKATYDWLLFLDADVFPKQPTFISEYLKQTKNEATIINGGIVYQKEKPEKSRVFRWVYGKKREALSYETRNKNPYLSFLTLNFLIHKSIFEKVRFNESIPNLRHEDTLFSFNLMEHQIPIIHTNNPICHLGLDVFEIAIRKENESLVALKYLLDNKILSSDYLKISKAYTTIKNLKLQFLFGFFYAITQSVFLRNLASENPSLFIFDLYRLGYLCQLDT